MRNQPSKQNPYLLRSGLAILPAQQAVIEQEVTELAQKLPARLLLLTDVTGQVVLARGEQSQIDLVALGSLVAGDLAASQEIARLTGEYQDYQMILREGQTGHTFISEAGLYLALLIQLSNEVPLGWARMLIKETAHRLAEIAARSLAEAEQLQAEQSDPVLSQEELPDLFNNALDELWSE